MIYLVQMQYIILYLAHVRKTSEGNLQQDWKIPFQFLTLRFPMEARVIKNLFSMLLLSSKNTLFESVSELNKDVETLSQKSIFDWNI